MDELRYNVRNHISIGYLSYRTCEKVERPKRKTKSKMPINPVRREDDGFPSQWIRNVGDHFFFVVPELMLVLISHWRGYERKSGRFKSRVGQLIIPAVTFNELVFQFFFVPSIKNQKSDTHHQMIPRYVSYFISFNIYISIFDSSLGDS